MSAAPPPLQASPWAFSERFVFEKAGICLLASMYLDCLPCFLFCCSALWWQHWPYHQSQEVSVLPQESLEANIHFESPEKDTWIFVLSEKQDDSCLY